MVRAASCALKSDSDFHIRRLVACPFDLRAEEFLRNIEANTRPVARLAICVHSAAMPDIFQRLDRFLYDVTTGCAVNRRDEANTAIGVLIRRIIGMGID
jgi:hypothetical protein